MTELATWHKKLTMADEWIREVEAGNGTGDLLGAALKIRKVLIEAIKWFLAGVGPPPTIPENPTAISDLKRLVASRYQNKEHQGLGAEVARALNSAAEKTHPSNKIGTPPTDLVRQDLHTARQFVNSLEPILANRQARGG